MARVLRSVCLYAILCGTTASVLLYLTAHPAAVYLLRDLRTVRSLKILALSGSCMIQAAKDMGLCAVSEVFADRGYQPDGSLVPRTQPGAMVTDEDEMIHRVIRMAREGKVTAVDGTDIEICADSVCVHGDGEKALAFVERICRELKAAGVEIRRF